MTNLRSNTHEISAELSRKHDTLVHSYKPMFDLSAAALQTVTDNGFHPTFPPEALAELNALVPSFTPGAIDQRDLLWSSIDNDTSRDLDQIEVAEALPDGRIKVLVGIADVDAYVRKGLALDSHAQSETTTVYAEVRTFPMLPEQLSTGLTSLLENEDRAAVVTEFIVGLDGEVTDAKSYAATVRNKAQLTYNGVGPWLDGTAPAPPKVAASPELQAQLKLQNTAAQRLLEARHRLGALSFERTETSAVIENGQVTGLVANKKNSGGMLIENFMVAANEAMARTFVDHKVSSIRRVVSQPARWDRIVELAQRVGGTLPAQPDVKALNEFLLKRSRKTPIISQICLSLSSSCSAPASTKCSAPVTMMAATSASPPTTTPTPPRPTDASPTSSRSAFSNP